MQNETFQVYKEEVDEKFDEELELELEFDAEAITEDLAPVSELMRGLTTELAEGKYSPSIAQLSCVEKFSKEQLKASVTELSLFLFRLVRNGCPEGCTKERTKIS